MSKGLFWTASPQHQMWAVRAMWCPLVPLGWQNPLLLPHFPLIGIAYW